MRSVTYSMGVSLDGYIIGPDGGFDWATPDDEVFRFVTDEIREVGVHLLGRRLYETMLYWETADQDPSLDESMLEWAALWKRYPWDRRCSAAGSGQQAALEADRHGGGTVVDA
jgi:dihydrofolate reductase